MAPVFRRTAAGLHDWHSQLQRFRGRQSRSVASNIYPHLDTNSPATSRAMRPQGNVASRMYPHLPSASAARMQKPKPKPRVSRARRYGDLE
jgi:hypothetical protein